MPELENWLILIGIFALALASPGPDFVMAIRNSVLYSRRAGMWTAAGFACGVAFHVSYCLAGLAAIIAHSELLFTIVKMIGALYLGYVGIRALFSRGMAVSPNVGDGAAMALTNAQAFRGGLITNLFNPKATMFFLALFTQIINPEAMLSVQVLYGATCVVMTFSWFSIVACVLTMPRIRAKFLKASKWIDRICGGLFIALGLRLALAKN